MYLNNVQLIKKAGLALKYSTTSVNILTDKVKGILSSQIITPFPRVITLYITNKCNLNCSMCLNAKYRNKNILDKGINIKTIRKILPELNRYKPMVCITGGEPLLNPDIIKIISLLTENKILTSMTTNGFLLEKYAQQIADSGLEFLTISLDHYKEDKHDQSRGVNNTYKRLLAGLNQLNTVRKKTPTNIKINTVIRLDNFSILSKMYDFIEELGVDEWSIQHHSFTNPTARKIINEYLNKNPLGNYIVGNPISTKFYLNTKQIHVLQKQLTDIKRKGSFYKTKVSVKPEIEDVFSYYQGKFPSKKSSCIWPFVSINIMESSKVALCLGNEIGDLNQNISIKKIWQSPKTSVFQKLILREKNLPLCFRCCGLNYSFDK